MKLALKAFLKAVSLLALFGGPAVGVISVVGAAVSGADFQRLVVVGAAAAYMVVLSLIVGGVIALLLSIDDRLARLEGQS